MEKVKKPFANKDEAVPVEQPQVPNHTETIKSQVLAKIGKLPRLDRVEVSRHHHGKYRVNIWEQPEPNKNLAVTIGPRIRSSYYLTVSDTGEIMDSNPPLTKLCLSA
jgi:ABC-type Zn2+ transport system substrate-binding protein/surface adhesin